MFICSFCKKQCKNDNSLRNHERLCKHNPNRQHTPFTDGTYRSTGKNQYTKAKELGLPPPQISIEGKKRIAERNKQRGQTLQAKEKLSKLAKERNLGGHTSKQKLYFVKKSGEVVYLHSSYEIKFASLLEEMNIEWERPEPFIWYDHNNKQHKYYPDFKINNIYIDTKNDYLAKVDLPKIEAVKKLHNVDLRIVTKDNITKEYIASLV